MQNTNTNERNKTLNNKTHNIGYGRLGKNIQSISTLSMYNGISRCNLQSSIRIVTQQWGNKTNRFQLKVDEIWGSSSSSVVEDEPEKDVESSRLLLTSTQPQAGTTGKSQSTLENAMKSIAWYVLLMPIWCFVSDMGQKKLKLYQEKESLKSPHMNRLGKCEPMPQLELQNVPPPRQHHRPRSGSFGDAQSLVPSSSQPNLGPKMLPYGAIVSGGNKAIGAAILAKKQSEGNLAKKKYQEDDVETDIDIPPTWYDFCIAIFFIAFGFIALFCGMISILMTN